MTIRHSGGDLNLTMTMAYPWGYPYTFELGEEAKLTQVATMQHDSTGISHRIKDDTWAGSAAAIRAGEFLLACLCVVGLGFEGNVGVGIFKRDRVCIRRIRFAEAIWEA